MAIEVFDEMARITDAGKYWAEHMSYESWINLFAKNTEDPLVRDALGKVGIQVNAVEIGRDEIAVRKNIPGAGITVVFTDEAFLYQLDDMAIGEGPPVLSEMNFWLRESDDGALYSDPLPFDLHAEMSRSDARAKLGEPVMSDDDPPWDQWRIDEYVLTAEYTDNENSLSAVSVELAMPS